MKLTEWFPSYVKPARRGVYCVMSAQDDLGYAYFDGRLWGWREGSVRSANRMRETGGADQEKRWRGLAKKP